MSTDQPVVTIETDRGVVTAALRADVAMATVANFLRYADDGFFDGLIFHRVIPGFMIQGGGFTPDMSQKSAGDPIANEASADLPNTAGTLAMARTSDPHSATCQFFINLADNDFLNHRDESADGFGYCVFGEVTDGFDVVEAIGGVETGRSGHFDDVPVEPVVIKSIRRAT